MSKYICLADGSWTTPSESAGSIQCQSGSIEICAINTDNTGIKISQGDMIAFSGTVYVRSTNKKQAIFTAVPFDIRGGGGGGGGGTPYTLPTASASVKGGIKIGKRLTITGEVLSADSQTADWSSTKTYAVGDTVSIDGKLYRCNTAHTASSPVDMSKWDAIYSDLAEWSANTGYNVGSVVIKDNSLYRCKTAHTSGSTFDTTEKANWDLIGGGSGGDAKITEDITANTAAGAIKVNDKVLKDTTFTQFVKQLLIAEIAPTATFTATNSGLIKIGDSKTTVLKLVINNNGTGTPQSIVFMNGTTTLDTQTYVAGTNTYTYTPTDVIESATTGTITFKAILNYKKSDNSNATLTKEQKFTFVDPVYSGAVTSAPASSADVLAVGNETASGANAKGRTITYTLSNEKSCYCYPTSLGALTSIKDANNFEYINSYDRATVSVTRNITTTTGGATTRTASYYVYTLKDPVTITGFKQIFA